MPYFYFDPTYILVIVGILICGVASLNVKATYARYKNVKNLRGLRAEEVAQQILSGAGIYNVRIERVRGDLTDHYDPSAKVLRLSDSVYGSASIAAIGVAAHECGHAIQDKEDYTPIRVRNAIVPVVNIGSTLSWPMIILGLFFSRGLVNLGILLFSLVVVFQLVTLPVEFNASRRALRILSDSAALEPKEVSKARKVLTAAALTYVAAAVSTILQLLRLIILFGNRDD